MSPATRLPALGDPVSFTHGTAVLSGIVNGEPYDTRNEQGLRIAVYVPVHVPATNQNMMVAWRNILAEVVVDD